MEPRDDLAGRGAFCLAQPGKLYAIYLPAGGSASVKLGPGRYRVQWYNPRTGRYTALGETNRPEWRSPNSPDVGDRMILLEK
ncbi:MAG: hypothetical protein IT210_24585 [Armatimonadetes bacterium]|nr:hypothetical protein [Armatimonadota bacterium]